MEGPNSMHENIVTPMEAKQLREALNEHAQKSAPAGATLVHLDHIACIDGGELRYITGRKAPAYDCELYAMPNGGSAPQLYAAPTTQPAPQQEAQEPFAWHVCSVNSDGSLSLEHAAAWEEAAHEHINDAITEHDIEGAGSWVVRPAYHAPQSSPAAQGDALDAARYRWLRDKNNPLEQFDYGRMHPNGTSCYHMVGGVRELKSGEELDCAIDAARAAQGGK